MRPLAEVCLIAAFLLPAGCGFFSLGGPSLTSSDPALKIPAIKAAGETRDHRAIPDLIDALACAAVARRLHAGTARPFPDPPPRDACGLPMAIWA